MSNRCESKQNKRSLKRAPNMNPLYLFRLWSHVVGEVSFWYKKKREKVPCFLFSIDPPKMVWWSWDWTRRFALFFPTWRVLNFKKWFDWCFNFLSPPRAHTVGSVPSEKGGVCHLPIKFHEHHLSLSTAIVTYWHVFVYVNVSSTKNISWMLLL